MTSMRLVNAERKRMLLKYSLATIEIVPPGYVVLVIWCGNAQEAARCAVP
jgi:hypothetical protein